MFICVYVKIFDFSRIGRVMVSVLASGAGLKPKTIKLVFVASPLNTQQ